MIDKLLEATKHLSMEYWILFAIVCVLMYLISNKIFNAKQLMSIFYSFIAAFILFFCIIFYQKPPTNILYKGYVREDTNEEKGIQGVNVTLLDYPEIRANTRKTDKEGYFEFKNIPVERSANVEFKHPDYSTQTKRISLVRTNNHEDDIIYLVKNTEIDYCGKLEELKKEAINAKGKNETKSAIYSDSIDILRNNKLSTLKYDTLYNNLNYSIGKYSDFLENLDTAIKDCNSKTKEQKTSIFDKQKEIFNSLKNN